MKSYLVGCSRRVLEGCEEELPETTGPVFVPCQDVDAHETLLKENGSLEQATLICQ